MFEDLSGDNYQKCFVAADYVRNEMLACFPSSGSDVVDKALIWNWKDNTFSFRDLPNTSYIHDGIVDITAGATWNASTEDWDLGTGAWGERNYDNVKKNLVFSAGFSVLTYTGNNTAGATIGHGLSSAPELIITKGRTASASAHSDDWSSNTLLCTYLFTNVNINSIVTTNLNLRIYSRYKLNRLWII